MSRTLAIIKPDAVAAGHAGKIIAHLEAAGFKAERGRYHLYVSLACPWAHRTLIFRALKRLEEVVSVSIVDPVMAEGGWEFGDGPGDIPDFVNGFRYLREVYTAVDPSFSGRVTVPVLWDKQTSTIVNNESASLFCTSWRPQRRSRLVSISIPAS